MHPADNSLLKATLKTTSVTILFKDVATTCFKQKPTVKILLLRNAKHSLSSDQSLG